MPSMRKKSTGSDFVYYKFTRGKHIIRERVKGFARVPLLSRGSSSLFLLHLPSPVLPLLFPAPVAGTPLLLVAHVVVFLSFYISAVQVATQWLRRQSSLVTTLPYDLQLAKQSSIWWNPIDDEGISQR
ncbi:hypothetical protein SESBI_49963 [Sesbania bispinosa]|nr:hypothetical protein SESBI_49963 [Sesbania bispinosa]